MKTRALRGYPGETLALVVHILHQALDCIISNSVVIVTVIRKLRIDRDTITRKIQTELRRFEPRLFVGREISGGGYMSFYTIILVSIKAIVI
jgi:hypothetical protein